MTYRPTAIASAILTSVLATSVFAEQYDVPGDFPTIQAALDAIPMPGGVEHVVSVAPGVYAGEILTFGKGFTLRCSSDEDQFTIAESPFLLWIEFVPADKQVVIENAIFRDTVYGPDDWDRVPAPVRGGGLRVWSVDVQLHNCRFERCGMNADGDHLDYVGGGIHAAFGSSVLMRDCSLVDCGATVGGALAAVGGSVDIRDCSFERNQVEDWDGWPEGLGGHVYLYEVGDDSIFERCTFESGRATVSGSAVYATRLGSLEFLECVFERNVTEIWLLEGGTCGACFVSSRDPLDYNRQIHFDRCTFEFNSAHQDETGFFEGVGGAIRAVGNTLIENSTFDRNSAGYGGTIFHARGPLTIHNCTIDHGDGTYGGGGIVLNSQDPQYSRLAVLSDVKVRNCRADDEGVSCGSSGGICIAPGTVAIMQRLIVADNYQQDQDGRGFEGGGLVFGNDDWACENDGVNQVSLSRSTICGNTVEFVPNNVFGNYVDPGNNRISDECIFPDLSLDGVVDGQDLAIVLGLWGEDCIGCQADLDDSGMIDGADLTKVLGAWGAGS